jgi:hypothetical protein
VSAGNNFYEALGGQSARGGPGCPSLDAGGGRGVLNGVLESSATLHCVEGNNALGSVPAGPAGEGSLSTRLHEHAALVIQQAVRCHAARLTYYMLLGIEADFGALSPPDSGREPAGDMERYQHAVGKELAVPVTGPEIEEASLNQDVSSDSAAGDSGAAAVSAPELATDDPEAPAVVSPQPGQAGSEPPPEEAALLPAVQEFQQDHAAVRVDMAACTIQCTFRCYIGKCIPDMFAYKVNSFPFIPVCLQVR